MSTTDRGLKVKSVEKEIETEIKQNTLMLHNQRCRLINGLMKNTSLCSMQAYTLCLFFTPNGLNSKYKYIIHYIKVAGNSKLV